MVIIGVTGGLGSGKSSVAQLLASHGAEVIDADALARAALEPGTGAFDEAVERFGPEIVGSDGRIDRPSLAAVVFNDPAARRDLEAIVHPVVRDQIAMRLAELGTSHTVVVLDVPLLVETGGRERYGIDGVLVVDVPEEIAVERVERDRGLDRPSALARLRAQADPGERLRAADFIILNHGTRAELKLMVDRAWWWIENLRVELGR